MKIFVFGATGKTGQLVTHLLLEQQHHVTAYVRNPNKLTQSHVNLKVVEGSMEDSKKITEAMMGHDAVISCLGSASLKVSSGLHDFGKQISHSMTACSIRRIAYMASAGVENEVKGLPGLIVRLVLKNVLKDHAAAIACFMTPDFDYTILRPMGLTDGPLTKNFLISQKGIPGYKSISRYDVAYCIVDAITQHNYMNESIGLCGH
jgi:putative NADH-flavin reductase